MLRCLLHRAAGSRQIACLPTKRPARPAAEDASLSVVAGRRRRPHRLFPLRRPLLPPPSNLGQTDLSSPGRRRAGPGPHRRLRRDVFELSIAGKVPGAPGGRRSRGPLVLSAPGGFVATWKVASASAFRFRFSVAPPSPSRASPDCRPGAPEARHRPRRNGEGEVGSGSGGASFTSSSPTAARGAEKQQQRGLATDLRGGRWRGSGVLPDSAGRLSLQRSEPGRSVRDGGNASGGGGRDKR